MLQELVYTSWPHGLRKGTHGFCTVASTPGMPPNLVQILEKLSAYRHLAHPGTPEARINPVNYRFVWITVGGRRLAVCSRVADAGLDYSGRTNKIAHHVVLPSNQLPEAGPAWLLTQPHFFFDRWEGEPRVLQPREIPDTTLAAASCDTWQQVTGDTGYAGLLLEAAQRKQAMEMLFTPPGELLQLYLEVHRLLSPEQRWNCTFETYHCPIPPNVTMDWRAFTRDSEEALTAKRLRPNQTIDLLAPLPLTESSYVDQARRGVRHMPLQQKLDGEPAESGASVAPDDWQTDERHALDREPDPLQVGPPELTPTSFAPPTPPELTARQRTDSSDRRFMLVTLTGIAASLLFLTSGVTALLVWGREDQSAAADEKKSQVDADSRSAGRTTVRVQTPEQEAAPTTNNATERQPPSNEEPDSPPTYILPEPHSTPPAPRLNRLCIRLPFGNVTLSLNGEGEIHGDDTTPPSTKHETVLPLKGELHQLDSPSAPLRELRETPRLSSKLREPKSYPVARIDLSSDESDVEVERLIENLRFELLAAEKKFELPAFELAPEPSAASPTIALLTHQENQPNTKVATLTVEDNWLMLRWEPDPERFLRLDKETRYSLRRAFPVLIMQLDQPTCYPLAGVATTKPIRLKELLRLGDWKAELEIPHRVLQRCLVETTNGWSQVTPAQRLSQPLVMSKWIELKDSDQRVKIDVELSVHAIDDGAASQIRVRVVEDEFELMKGPADTAPLRPSAASAPQLAEESSEKTEIVSRRELIRHVPYEELPFHLGLTAADFGGSPDTIFPLVIVPED